jgi:ribosomal protein S8
MTIQYCAYCAKEYTPKRKNNKYCSATCRIYASQERTGVRITKAKTPESIGSTLCEEDYIKEIATLEELLETTSKNINMVLNNTIIYESREQLKLLENQVVISSEERIKRNEKALRFYENIQRIEAHFLDLEKELPNLYDEKNAYITKLFRATEAYNEFMTKDIDRKGALNGEQLDRLEYYATYYPFELYEKSKHETFFNNFLGLLKKPFSIYISQYDNDLIKKLYNVMVKDMLVTLNPKILFIGYAHQKYNQITESATNENFYFKYCHHKQDILTVIQTIKPEIVFLECYEALKLDVHFIRKLKDVFYNVSFFFNTDETIDELINFADYHIAMRGTNEDGQPIFLINEDANYQIDLLQTFIDLNGYTQY